jgi:AraC family transcriptional regulator
MHVHAMNRPRSETGTAPGSLADHLVVLLTYAARVIETDQQSAKEAIDRVSRLLRSDVDRRASKSRSRGAAILVNWQIRRVVEYVDGQLPRPIRVEELSRVVGRSTSYFSRAFRTTFGVSPQTYVMRCRLRNASDLMITTGMTFADIALECGFSDQAHLCRNFRDLKGTTPASWRREHKNHSPAAPGCAQGNRSSPQID